MQNRWICKFLPINFFKVDNSHEEKNTNTLKMYLMKPLYMNIMSSRKPCREMRDLTQSLHILRTLESFPVSFPGLSLVFPGSCREIFRELIKISGNRCTGNEYVWIYMNIWINVYMKPVYTYNFSFSKKKLFKKCNSFFEYV